MNILCISKDLSCGPLVQRLQKEGNRVKVFVDDHNQRIHLHRIVEQTKDWKKELGWVGQKGLILFDSVGYGKIQDNLRNNGYSVVGGCHMADKLEHDRQYGQKIMSSCGIKVIPSFNFCNAKEAIGFLLKSNGPWVVKQNGHSEKSFIYVGQLKNNADSIELLKNYLNQNSKECHSIELQKKVEGVEIGVGRYFNGSNWVGPIEMNMEHKNLFSGDLGPKTFEMGTLTWYDDNEKNIFFKKLLSKLKPYLQSIKFHGDIDINCIANEKGIYPLEITARFGYPALQLQTEFHLSPWAEFLKAVADSKDYKLKYRKGYGIIALLAVPPFPYEARSKKYYPQGIRIFFKEEPKEEDWKHLHFEEICRGKKEKNYYISGKTGFVMHVSGFGKTAEEARTKTYKMVKNIVIPKMFYRTDIGEKFVKEDQKKLKKWGWI